MKSLRRQIIAASICLVMIAGVFWVFSRYPMIFEELYRARDGTITARPVGMLTKSEYYALALTDDVPVKIFKTAVNWVYANRWGMLFGIIFGAAAMVLLDLLRRTGRSFEFRGVRGAAFGALVGAPLGVCANCVAPIGAAARSHKVGAVPVLAAMVASPTLNPVGLTVLFAALPPSLVWVRLVAVSVIIFWLIPFAVRFCREEKKIETLLPVVEKTNQEESWRCAVFAVGGKILKKIVFLSLVMLPLMLLAGLAGAALVVLFPPGSFDVLKGFSLENLFTLLTVSALGSLLPLTTLADVVVITALAQSGVGLPVLAVLAVVLPTTSVFALLIQLKYFPPRTVWLLQSGIVLIGAVSGFIFLFDF